MNPRNFFGELKRRNVYKVAIAYAVVAWLLMQIATQVFPFLEIPNWAIRLVIMLLALGFPIALIIAWAFELTPEGLKRTEEAADTARQRSRSAAWIYVVAIGAALSTGLFILGHYTAQRTTSSQIGVAVRIPASEVVQQSVPEKSVVVLPFANLSRDPDNAYFAAGIQDEIITRLAKIAELRVISCTSMQRFKSAPDDLPAIAKQVGVANVLQGSVQRSADEVRVNVQLIRADTDAHLWADTFDRKLTDIFKIESEIAKTVAETLQAKLSGSEQHAIAARPTENPEAYQFYLKGRYYWEKRTAQNLKKAIDQFQQAADEDPNYALAYVGVADCYSLLEDYVGTPASEAYPKAKALAERALQLDSSLTEAHTSLAYAYTGLWQWEKAEAEFKRAIELNPNYATAHQWYGNSDLVALARFDEATAEVKRAIELDPLSLVINTDLGTTYYRARRYDEAIDQLRKTLEMDPGFYYARWNLGSALVAKGALDAAIREYQKARALSDNPLMLGLLAHAYGFSGNKAEAMKIVDELKELSKQRYVSAYSFALVYLGLGDKEEALRWLAKSYQDRAGDALRYIRVEPLLDPLRGDPRFEELVAKVFAPKNGSSP
jgi:TolB-like protein/Tfp pilus assembly protein PilF